MDDMFRFVDDLGPAKIVHINEPRVGLRAILVVDNFACGPAIGGVRMAPDVTAEEAFRLARAMTFKNAAAGLRHGGGKAVIVADPRMPAAQKERLIRSFARAIRTLTEYVPGPDMGTDERCMAWIEDENGRAVGLPPEIGGIPLDEIGATGYGLCAATEVASRRIGMRLEGARLAVQGYGSVGRHSARFLAEKGVVLVAAADSHCTIHNAGGLNLDRLEAIKARGESLDRYGEAEHLDRDAVVGVDCDIWIPAARPDVIHDGNVGRLKARLIVQGANIPITPEAEKALHARGVLAVPDFIANAGGVICAAVEYHGGTQAVAFQTIREKIVANTEAVLARAAAEGSLPRAAANALAEGRVRRAMEYRQG